MKNRKLLIFLVILLSVVCAALIAVMVLAINNKLSPVIFNVSPHVSFEEIDTLVWDETYSGDFTDISAKTDYGNINIRHADDENIRVVIYGDADKTTVTAEKNHLRITANHKTRVEFFGAITREAKTEIYVPESYAGRITLINDAGEITADSYPAASIEIEQDAGNTTLQTAQTATVTVHAGNVKIGTVADAAVTCDLGNINIDTVTDVMHLHNDCGNIDVKNANIKKDSVVSNNLGNIDIGKTGRVFIDAHTSLGNTNIRSNDRKSDITLTLTNDCGNITVKN
ncbi:MAG: DUF4097 family beta strand repeat protein [Clostridia bacterium]|nr:DUF4097 family beta strand repeat protein [Clostridia bacterium]